MLQQVEVGPCRQLHADVLQVGVKGAGKAGSGSATISVESVSLKTNADIAWFAGASSSMRGMWPKRRHRVSITYVLI